MGGAQNHEDSACEMNQTKSLLCYRMWFHTVYTGGILSDFAFFLLMSAAI